MHIADAQSPDDLPLVRTLFQEYAAGVGIDLCFQNFEQELAELPGRYAPPRGRLLLAWEGNEVVGCVALRDLDGGVCEMKRLYVRPAFRSHGTGRALADAIIHAGWRIGYERMRLDTLDTMKLAIALYESLGFQRIAPYCDNPSPAACFFELKLR